MVSVAVVSMLDAVRLAPPNWPESAIEKQPACAAAINSSGFVPGVFSNRVLKEYGVLFNTPLEDDTAPLPSFSPPFQTALALRCMFFSYEDLCVAIVDASEGSCQVLEHLVFEFDY